MLYSICVLTFLHFVTKLLSDVINYRAWNGRVEVKIFSVFFMVLTNKCKKILNFNWKKYKIILKSNDLNNIRNMNTIIQIGFTFEVGSLLSLLGAAFLAWVNDFKYDWFLSCWIPLVCSNVSPSMFLVDCSFLFWYSFLIDMIKSLSWPGTYFNHKYILLEI